MSKYGKCLVMVFLGLLVSAEAAELTGVRTWAEEQAKGDMDGWLAKQGVADATSMTRTWEESEVLSVILKDRPIGVLAAILSRDTLSQEGYERIMEAVSEKELTGRDLYWVARMPLAYRLRWRDSLTRLVSEGYKNTPVLAAHWLKYTYLSDVKAMSKECDIEELVVLLLAPEPLRIADVARVKSSIKEVAIEQAKRHLRESGRSFVVRNGVNPLAEEVIPVVAALNAPNCMGLETALRDLGIPIEDVDRTYLIQIAGVWSEDVMLGKITGNPLLPVLGKLTVALGVDGYNDFVDRYNHGGE